MAENEGHRQQIPLADAIAMAATVRRDAREQIHRVRVALRDLKRVMPTPEEVRGMYRQALGTFAPAKSRRMFEEVNALIAADRRREAAAMAMFVRLDRQVREIAATDLLGRIAGTPPSPRQAAPLAGCCEVCIDYGPVGFGFRPCDEVDSAQ